jgi:hypothetical protein
VARTVQATPVSQRQVQAGAPADAATVLTEAAGQDIAPSPPALPSLRRQPSAALPPAGDGASLTDEQPAAMVASTIQVDGPRESQPQRARNLATSNLSTEIELLPPVDNGAAR